MIPLEIHPGAKAEFDEIHTLLRAEDSELAAKFARCVEENILLICDNPLLFHERRFTVRRSNLRPQFGEYYIAFILWRETVAILAVAHAKRRPFYYRERIGEARRMF